MSIKENFRPLHDKIVVQRLENVSQTAGGLVLTGSAAERSSKGKVLAVGSGQLLENGDTRTLNVKVGDTVLFGTYSEHTEKDGDNEYIIMKEDNILGIFSS